MFTKKLSVALAFVACVGLFASDAFAQSSTTGAIRGRVSDKDTGEPLAGVAVAVVSPNLMESQSALTDEGGAYKITNLPPGPYTVNFYYLEVTTQRTNIQVSVNATTSVFAKLNTAASKGEVIKINKAPPQIDTSDTKQVTSLNADYLKNMPVPGRTFEAALGAAPGSSGDGLGVSFSGSSSLENQYIVDGVNTTGLTFGTVGTALINDFIQEIEIITGAYNAEYGRATGGVINVVTKSGSNEFKGQVFSYITPGFAVAERKRSATQKAYMEADVNLRYAADIGFDLGGPIIKDKVWFYVGFAPRVASSRITTVTNRLTDCREVNPDGTLSECLRAYAPESQSVNGGLGYADQIPDVDPDTDFLIYEEIDRTNESDQTQTFQFLTKVNFAATPEHQGQVTLTATPGTRRAIGVFGEPQAVNVDVQQLVSDLSTKWTSKFNNNKTEVEAVVGWHRESVDVGSISDEANNVAGQRLLFGTMNNWSRRGFETDLTRQACTDSSAIGGGDDYPLIENCPDDGRGYLIGGPGSLADDVSQRFSGRVGVTQRVKAAGQHEVKAGVDIEDNRINLLRAFSGDVFYNNILGNQFRTDQNQVDALRWVRLAPPGFDPMSDSRSFDDRCGSDAQSGDEVRCDFLEKDRVRGRTINWSAYLRDSWQILPNLTFNAGLRYEEQRLRYREDLVGTRDPITGNVRGKNAMILNNMWAPRVGLIYDWTKEGRSKVSAHWGRFYDNIPLRINERSFGGEANLQQSYTRNTQCGATDETIGGSNASNCEGIPEVAEQIVGGAGILIAPGIKPQFMDELVLGAEYELIEDLKVGISYQNRRIGRVLEDVSVDNANTYILANPGEFDSGEENRLENEISALDTMAGGEACMAAVDIDSPACQRDRLQNDLDQFRGIRIFDKPRRDYHALQFLVNKRFSKNFFAQASYTYSVLVGNYPGKFSADTGQVDPNITSQFDLIELLANRDGRLPNDRPHYFKLDSWYRFDLKELGVITPGIRLRALSGTPIDALGAHYLYGFGESYILPRGELGRTDWDAGIDLSVSYGRKITEGINLEVFLQTFNVFNRQAEFSVSENYTFDDANPVVGGEFRDLIFLKSLDPQGNETNIPVDRNANFGNPQGRYGPFSARFGFRLTF